MNHSLENIAKHIHGEIHNPKSINNITGLNYTDKADDSELTLLNKQEHIKLWASSNAAAAIVSANIAELAKAETDKPIIIVKNADLAMAKALELFAKKEPQQNGIHPMAVIEPSAKIGANVSIGPGTYIGANVTIGDNSVIHANVSIYDDTTIGFGCAIWPSVVIRERTVIGSFCRLYSNCSIGSDGFGYRPADDGMGVARIPHIGNVVLGNYVDIGSNSCIDMAKFGSTTIGDFTKIDNLVQIGHNVEIGRGCMICGQAGIAGSTIIEDGVTIAGGAGVKDHIKIGRGAQVGAKAGVMWDIPAGESHMGYPAYKDKELAKQWIAIRKLPEILKKLKKAAKDMKLDIDL